MYCRSNVVLYWERCVNHWRKSHETPGISLTNKLCLYQKQHECKNALKESFHQEAFQFCHFPWGRHKTVVKMHIWWPNFNKIPSQCLWQAQTDTEHDSLMCLQQKNPGVRLRFPNPSYWRKVCQKNLLKNTLILYLIGSTETGRNRALTSYSLIVSFLT